MYVIYVADIKGVQKVVLALLWDIHVYTPLQSRLQVCVYVGKCEMILLSKRKLDLLSGALL